MCSILDRIMVDESDSSSSYESSIQPLAYSDLSRRDIRSLIFHVLYAVESYDYEESVEAVADNLSKGFNLAIRPDSEIVTTARQIVEMRDMLDEEYKPLLTNWRFDRISVSIKLIMRLAVWELLHTDMDQRIIINEAIELAKCFAEEDAYRFINGILDGIAAQQALDKAGTESGTDTEQ
jgi:N utilization substance protein B